MVSSPVTTGGFGALSPPNKAPSPSMGNVKHDKSVDFLSNFRMSILLHKRKVPQLKPIEDLQAMVLLVTNKGKQ